MCITDVQCIPKYLQIRAIRIPGLDHGGYETKPSRSQPTDNRSVHNSGAKPPRENSKQIVNVDEQVVGGTGTYAVDYSGSGSNSHGKRVVYEEDHEVHSPSKNKPIDYYEEDEEQPGGFDTRPIRPKKRNLYDDVDPEVDGQEAYNQQQSQGNGQEFPPGQHPFEGLDNRDDLPLPEEFSAKAREVTDLAKVIELIGEYRTRALFSGKCIPLRESCLLKIRRMVEAGEFVESPGHLAAIPALMTIVRVGLDDKISQVYLSAINLLELVIGLMKR